MMTKTEVAKAFEPQKLSPGQSMCIQKIQNVMKDAALEAMELCPSNPDRTAGLRLLLQAKQTLVQSISHGTSPEDALTKAKDFTSEEIKNLENNREKQALEEKILQSAKLVAEQAEEIGKLQSKIGQFEQAFIALEDDKKRLAEENEKLKNAAQSARANREAEIKNGEKGGSKNPQSS